MKLLLIASLFTVISAAKKCNHKEDFRPGCFKGKLEIKANCMNYTVSVIGGDLDSSLVVAKWTDDHSGKSYKDVFALGSRCNFPDSIQAGEEFYFTIDSTTKQNCSVCMMFYPVPPKQLSIKVVEGPCSK